MKPAYWMFWRRFRFVMGICLLCFAGPVRSFAVKESTSVASGPKVELCNPRLYFRITVLDEDTGRGIPLVKLTTLNGIEYYTDSAGVIAFDEPGLMNREVFFHIESHGYFIEKDGFDCSGRTLKVVPGESAVLKMRRVNVAQRLYRITGIGIYRDSVLLGDHVPIAQPLANAMVAGQDSTLVTTYRGNLFWVWGDTTNLRHPIAANFKTTCATSELPSNGGLDPEVGVNLHYFTEGDFVKKMVPLPGNWLYWLGSLLSVKDEAGRERLLANYAQIRPPLDAIGRGIVEFDDNKQVFKEVVRNSTEDVIQPDGHPFRVNDDGVEYIYYPGSLQFTRVKADYASILDHTRYEAFTCLKEGSRFHGSKDQLDRAKDGSLRYSWRQNTSPVGPKELDELVKAGLIRPEERWFQLVDVDTGKGILPHAHSIYWNPYRKRWVMIICEVFGTSMLGEIWYVEGDTAIGPWAYAKKVVTHNNYSFYNPVQHPHFAKKDGRVIFFEGTYTKSFSGNEVPTPRYEYNQMMYKLELDDPRLFLPVPIYQVEMNGSACYLSSDKIPEGVTRRAIAFYAPDRQREGTVPIYQHWDKGVGTSMLTAKPHARSRSGKVEVAFYALSGGISAPPPRTVPLYEFVDSRTHERLYSTEKTLEKKGYKRSKEPVCLVWEKPMEFNPYEIRRAEW